MSTVKPFFGWNKCNMAVQSNIQALLPPYKRTDGFFQLCLAEQDNIQYWSADKLSTPTHSIKQKKLAAAKTKPKWFSWTEGFLSFPNWQSSLSGYPSSNIHWTAEGSLFLSVGDHCTGFSPLRQEFSDFLNNLKVLTSGTFKFAIFWWEKKREKYISLLNS